ncbi:hypothetical protein FS418_07795 [Shewanella sp. YLB-09]|nr:hypothetical protein FS418_07795 [Shewanella sp. YLB-09]
MSSPLAYSENIKTEKMEYKCYLKTTKGYEIAFYRWEVNNFQINVAKLPAQKVPGSKIYIKDVEECVELNEMFSIGHAQKLDEETAR